METPKPYAIGLLIVLAALLGVIIGLVFYASVYGYQVIDGRLVGMEYTPGYSGVIVSAGNQNGPGTLTNFVPEKFTLIIDVNGSAESYSVSIDTYALALSGQTIFKMKCNKIHCVVME